MRITFEHFLDIFNCKLKMSRKCSKVILIWQIVSCVLERVCVALNSFGKGAVVNYMIKQLGAQGMIFFTFSAADLHWPDLHKLMPHGKNPAEAESEQESSKLRRQDLIDNPHIAAWFFEKRFKLFLKNVLIPKWEL